MRMLAIAFAVSLLVPLPRAAAQAGLPGTRPLTMQGDLAATMVDGINTYLLRETAAAADRRADLWKMDSVSAKRERLRRIIGAVDRRVPVNDLELDSSIAASAEIAAGSGYRVLAVRWQVLDDLTGEGLLLAPNAPPKARIVAIPDASWTPEMLAGLSAGVDPSAQVARRLAESGSEVLIPVLIDRSDTWSGIPGVRMTNLPHREWIYRMAYESGRHIIGYEVEKVLAATDWFAKQNAVHSAPIGVGGYGEGGLLALYAASLDSRIQATLVSGYFQSRQEVWKEPIYRDVWGLLREFGDAELAGMIAPRALAIEASRFPEITGPPPASGQRRGAAPGAIVTPPVASVRSEVDRARPFFALSNASGNLRFIDSGNGRGLPGSDEALTALLHSLAIQPSKLASAGAPVRDRRINFDPTIRLHRQFDQMVAHTQAVIPVSRLKRSTFWSKADASTPQSWKQSTRPMRDYIWNDMIGRLPDPNFPAEPRTRLI